MSKTVKANIIMQSKEYTSKMDEIMCSLYISEYVIVKHQDFENPKEIIDRTGEISYIHPNKTYFNVKLDDTSVEESYYPSDVAKGTVRLYKKGDNPYALKEGDSHELWYEVSSVS